MSGAAAWAVVDALDNVRGVMRSREDADRSAAEVDGWSVRPLVLAALDDVEPDAPAPFTARHARAAADPIEDRHVCPRREEAPPGWLAQHPGHDWWENRAGARCCSWCGSRNPDDLMALLRTGSVELGPTDKAYKAYLHTLEGEHAGKFYFQHLSDEQRREFVALLNAKAFPVGYPGHFYVLPFFAVVDR